MAWNPNDIIKLDLKQEYLEQALTNTLFWKVIEVTAGAIGASVLQDLAGFTIDQIATLQTAALEHIEQIFDNLTDGITQYVWAHSQVGDLTSANNAASFLALGMKKTVDSRATRPGSIRIAGLREADFEDNGLDAAAVTRALAAGNQLGGLTIIDDGGGNIAVFQPVVVGRNPDGSFDLTRINNINTIAQPILTTQNSRKPGR